MDVTFYDDKNGRECVKIADGGKVFDAYIEIPKSKYANFTDYIDDETARLLDNGYLFVYDDETARIFDTEGKPVLQKKADAMDFAITDSVAAFTYETKECRDKLLIIDFDTLNSCVRSLPDYGYPHLFVKKNQIYIIQEQDEEDLSDAKVILFYSDGERETLTGILADMIIAEYESIAENNNTDAVEPNVQEIPEPESAVAPASVPMRESVEKPKKSNAMKIWGIILICLGIVGTAIVASSGKLSDALIGGAVLLVAGILLIIGGNNKMRRK